MADQKKEHPVIPVQAVTVEELTSAFAGPALLSNRIYVTNTPAGIRLSFCEQQAEKAVALFRTAVVLSYPDALALRDLLTEQLKAIRFMGLSSFWKLLGGS